MINSVCPHCERQVEEKDMLDYENRQRERKLRKEFYEKMGDKLFSIRKYKLFAALLFPCLGALILYFLIPLPQTLFITLTGALIIWSFFLALPGWVMCLAWNKEEKLFKQFKSQYS